MENPVSTSPRLAVILENPASTTDAAIQSEEANPNAPASSDAKARQFAQMLDDQQQVTELEIKYETALFDPAQDIEINATYSEPGKTAQL
ncbi:hypothetical protein [Yoonia sp. BS5-3]|uniref:Uncharacterized protein n=1 Tax=Yoonia phaeophyticola TaxID=3137369 RepID=A0ABZ2V5C8_9RHOB